MIQDIGSRFFVDRVGQNGVELVQNVVARTRYVMREDLTRLDIDKALRTDVVKTLQGGLLSANKALTVAVFMVVTVTLIVRRMLTVLIMG